MVVNKPYSVGRVPESWVFPSEKCFTDFNVTPSSVGMVPEEIAHNKVRIYVAGTIESFHVVVFPYQ